MGGSPPPGEKSVAARTRSCRSYAPVATSEGCTSAPYSVGGFRGPAIFAVLAAVPGLCTKQTTTIIAPET